VSYKQRTEAKGIKANKTMDKNNAACLVDSLLTSLHIQY